MKRLEYICHSASTMMLTALGIDIMLPALSQLRHHFGLAPDSTATANIIVFFFMGQVAQLIFGILSDRFGRLPVLRIGFPLYIIGGVAAAYAPTLALMCAARFVAGIGASAVFTTTIAGVRDRFVGDKMASTMSFILTIFLFTPIVAPFLGIAILSIGSWKLVFLTPPLFAVFIFLWSFRLDESHPPSQRLPIRWKPIKQSLKKVLGNAVFIRYTILTTLLFSMLSVYVSGSEHIIGEIYGKPALFPWIFAGIGLVMSLSALYNARLSVRYGAKRAIRVLLLIYTLIAAILLMITIADGDPPGMRTFFVCVGLLMAINLAIEPNSSALALEPLGQTAGLAASMYGTIFFFVGSTLGNTIGQSMVHGVFPLVIGFFIIGVIALSLAWTDKHRSQQ
jgi:DHA1 family bicyclomycin/chloramphenicol resistance-like MFS transporter